MASQQLMLVALTKLVKHDLKTSYPRATSRENEVELFSPLLFKAIPLISANPLRFRGRRVDPKGLIPSL